MKAPGAAVLEFEVTPVDTANTRISLNVYWHPAGVWGLSYWSAMTPFHFIIFNGMVRKIAERAEQLELSSHG